LIPEFFYRTRRDIINDGFELNVAMNEIGYRYPDSKSRRLFWSLPSVFTGNKVKSYGGNLTLTQHITAYPSAQSYKDQDILLIGNGVTLFWTNPIAIQPDIPLVRKKNLSDVLQFCKELKNNSFNKNTFFNIKLIAICITFYIFDLILLNEVSRFNISSNIFKYFLLKVMFTFFADLFCSTDRKRMETIEHRRTAQRF